MDIETSLTEPGRTTITCALYTVLAEFCGRLFLWRTLVVEVTNVGKRKLVRHYLSQTIVWKTYQDSKNEEGK